MAIVELYSDRVKQREQAGKTAIYQYDELPNKLRVQVVQIWHEALGSGLPMNGLYDDIHIQCRKIWKEMNQIVQKRNGLLQIGNSYQTYDERYCSYFLTVPLLQALDMIELGFLGIDVRYAQSKKEEDWIKELNHWFRENGVGYEFAEGQIMRVDSQYVHAEVVLPALSLLQSAQFEGAQNEFLKAHKHYREGNHKEAIAEALKAFESAMKQICDERKLPYTPRDTAQALITILISNGFVPEYLLDHLSGVRKTLEAGVPTLRNKLAGHGQGGEVKEVHQPLVAYALHLAAANIVFLVETHLQTV